MSNENVVLLIPKGGVDQQFIFGKVFEVDSGKVEDRERYIHLEDVVLIQLMPTPQGVAPVHGYFPTVFVKEFVSENALNKRKHTFWKSEYEIFTYDEIKPQALDLYQKAMTERSGLILATKMPSMNG